jgi:hypothetical protein
MSGRWKSKERSIMDETETAKERIKRKMKEYAEELAKQAATAPQEPSKLEANRDGVDVLAIYATSNPKPKFLVQGNVKLKIHSIGLEVRNVPYSIDKKQKVNVQAPFRYHKFHDELEKPDAYIESIKFDDIKIWKEAVEVVKSAVLERHQEELTKTEASQEK